VSAHRIECDLRHAPSVWSTTTPGKAGPWLAMYKAGEALGVRPPHRTLSGDEMRAMFGQGPYYSGIVEERATRLQPALLARGLRRVAIGLGAQVFEQSPVTRILSNASSVGVETGGGRIVAGRVVLAANAWMAHLPAFRNLVTVISSDIVATDPIPDLLRERGLAERPAGVNSRLMLNYGGLTPEGRVYLGRGGGTIAYANRITADFDRSPRQAAEVEADFRYLYPELHDVPITLSWAGPIDRSPTGLPWFGRLPEDPRIHYGIGYSGHGVGASALGGRILASQLLDSDDEWADLGAQLRRARRGHYPPEPLRSLAGHAIRRSVVRKEQAERHGREGGRVDRLIAGFANASLPDQRRST
jgi:glycine/D-amino acid oxidase-like deaminating enzyme